MAKPSKPPAKDLKPKAEGDAAPAAGNAPAGGLDMKMILIVGAIGLFTLVGSVGGMFLLAQMVLIPAMHKDAPATGEHKAPGAPAAEAHDAKPAASHVGMNLELDEFMVNLKPDPTLGGNQYLRTKLSLSIQVPPAEDCYHTASALGAGVIVGAAAPVNADVALQPLPADGLLLANEGGGEGGGCDALFKKNMGRYVPAMRDIINAALMKRTATTLASLQGQEDLKNEIKTELNKILDAPYHVLRVNLQDFIIQR